MTEFNKQKSYLKIQKIKIKEQLEFNEKQRVMRILSKSSLFFAPLTDDDFKCSCAGCSQNKDHIVSDEVKNLISKIPNRVGLVNFKHYNEFGV
jgi:hypothetical protein